MAVASAVVILVAVGIALIVTSSPGKVTASSPAAQRLVRAALRSTIAGGSFHYVSRLTSRGATQTIVGDAGPTSGKQVITVGPDTFTVLVVGTACYFQGDERQLVDQLGLTITMAATYAGQWISLAPGDPPYQSVYVAVTTHSALQYDIEFAPHQESGVSRRSGYRVIGVTGPITNVPGNGQTQPTKGTASLYVTSSAPHLPVEYTENGKVGKVTSKVDMTFSQWGEVVAEAAPPSAVGYASLSSGNATTPTTGPPVLTRSP
jgi:archaellum component FlaF (FlaF/FlaG flagellin family)